jgi:two-component system, NarL family, invasion response regulator UvrY
MIHADAGTEAAAATTDTGGTSGRPRVLLATMQHALRDAIHDLLTDEGIPVVGQVDSGSAAVTFVTRERPDVVVMGLLLAGSLSAFDTLRLIKQAVEPTQIIVLVGVRSDPTAQLARDSGASVVLDEAGQPGLLLEAIALLWAEREASRQPMTATIAQVS